MDLAPLPVTTIERVFLWMDRPSHPYHCCFRVRFSGALQHERFTQAARLTLERHPLLRSRLRGSLTGALEWIPGPAANVVIDWQAGSVDGPYPEAHPIDLFSTPGTRLIVRAEATRADFFLHLHHACCDGRGMLEFIADLVSAYARLGGVSTAPLPPLNLVKLRQRGRIPLGASQLWSLATHLDEAVRFLFRKPAPIVAASSNDEDPCLVRHAQDFTLGANEATALKHAAANQGVTINDLLIRDFFLALIRCRQRWGADHPGDRLRLMVPVSLRTHKAADLPAANVLSPVFLDRFDADAEDPDALLAGIHAEMERIKRHGLASLFVLGHGLARPFNRWVRAQYLKPRCWLSASLTHLGRLPRRGSPPRLPDGRIRAGDVVMESIHAVAPNRPGQAVTLGAVAYAGRLHFTVHTDIHHLSPQQGAELREAFLDRIRRTLAKTPAAQVTEASTS